MVNEAKKYTVTILGTTYTLRSDEPEQHVFHAGALVNSLMTEIMQKADHLQDKQVAVLAELKIASKLLHLESVMHQNKQLEQMLIEQISKELSDH